VDLRSNLDWITYVIWLFQDILFPLDFSLKNLLRPLDEFLGKFHLEVVLRSFSDLESPINFWNGVGFLPGELASLNKNKIYHRFAIKFLSIKFSFGLHSGVNVSVNDKGLPSHSDIFFGNDLLINTKLHLWFPRIPQRYYRGYLWVRQWVLFHWDY